MEYLLNPKLDVLPAMADTWRGNPFEDGQFRYLQDPFKPQWSAVARMLLTPNPQREQKKADNWRPPVHSAIDHLEDREGNWIIWLGHACYLFQLNGLRFLTDPQLADMPLVKRRVHPPFHYGEFTGIDYILLSHDHRDHVDESCLRTLCAHSRVRKILAPLKLAEVIGDWVGDTPIEEAGWYQRFDLADTGVTITFLPARHWCRRGLTDFNRRLWGSFMVELGEVKIYFGADSASTGYWREIGTLFPSIDVAMLGIGAYKPEYMMRSNHANPAEAFQGFRDLGARYWWPMHHGTYDLSNEPPSEPILWATRLMNQHGLGERLLQPAINEPWWVEGDR